MNPPPAPPPPYPTLPYPTHTPVTRQQVIQVLYLNHRLLIMWLNEVLKPACWPLTTNKTKQKNSSVHMVSFTLAYVLGSILPSIPADRLFARRACRCSGQNGRLLGCIFWNKCPRSNCHCRWSGMSTLAPSACRSVPPGPGTTHALFPTVFGWQKN